MNKKALTEADNRSDVHHDCGDHRPERGRFENHGAFTPFPEQGRIVAQVDGVMSLADFLGTRLATSEKLLQAAVAELTTS